MLIKFFERKSLKTLLFVLVILYCILQTLKVFLTILPGLLTGLTLLIAIALSIILFFINFRCRIFAKATNINDLLVILTITFVAFPTIFHYVFLDEIYDYLGRSSHQYISSISFLSIIWMVFGIQLGDIELKRSNNIALTIIFLLLFLFLLNSDDLYIINYEYLSGGQEKSSHLELGIWASFLIIFCFSASQGFSKFIVFIAAFLLFYSMGGRTSLLSFAFSIVLLSGYRRGNYIKTILSLSLITILFLYVVNNYANYLENVPALHRMLFLGGLEADASFLGRKEQLENGVEMLYNQALIGDPTLIIKSLGSIGSYIHNILSAWQFYGIACFLIIIFDILFIITRASSKIKLFQSFIGEFSLLTFLYSVFCVFIGKYIGFYLFWFSLGLCLGRLKRLGGLSKNASAPFSVEIDSSTMKVARP